MEYRFILIVLFSIISQFIYAQKYYLFAGTYTGTGSKGIYVYEFDTGNGETKLLGSTDSASNPSYLTVSKNDNFIYAVNENGGEKPGRVSAFSFNKNSFTLTHINSQLTGGDHPCYISIDDAGKWIVVANYTGGSVSIFPVQNDGSIGKRSQRIQHSGNSINKIRQEKPHVHAVVFSNDHKYLFTPDLGTDKVMIYTFDGGNQLAPLQPSSPPFINVGLGDGPRHITFHPNGQFAYLINELAGKVTVFKYKNGDLKSKQEVITHPANYKGTIGSADIHISPDGKFLYASNRGEENTLTIFSIKRNGKLKLVGFESTGGKTPRNFVIDPSGKYLLAANQETDNVAIFSRDMKTGKLTDTGNGFKISKPVCLKFGGVLK